MFRFTISNLGIFLGKSPVTIRGWERKGFVALPRVGVNRSLSTEEVRNVARTAWKADRISYERWQLISEALTSLQSIEETE